MGKMKDKIIDEQENAEPTQEVETSEEGLTTQVMSLADEEERLGEKLEMPSPEQLVANASMGIIANRKHLAGVLNGLGKKAIVRATMAALDLPKEGEPVRLVSKEEKLAFRLMQSTIRAMFTVLFYHTSEEIINKHKEEQKAKEEENQKSNKEDKDAKQND
jgi:hypothetical protein